MSALVTVQYTSRGRHVEVTERTDVRRALYLARSRSRLDRRNGHLDTLRRVLVGGVGAREVFLLAGQYV